jgi:hypothetical protein
MNMNWNKKQRTLKLLEEKLRALSNIEVPPMLEAKLLTQIPNEQLGMQRLPNYRWFEFWSWGLSTAFAAVLIIGVILFHYSSPLPVNGYIADPVEMPFGTSIIKQSKASLWPVTLSSEPNFKLNKEPNSGVEKGL